MQLIIVTLSVLFCFGEAVSEKYEKSSFGKADLKQTAEDIYSTDYTKWGESLVFEENFNGSSLDLDKWEYWEGCDERQETGNMQCYTKENVAVHNGTLVITAKKQEKNGKQYTSGRIRQKGSGFLNASYVIRAKLARGDLLWSALRLFPTKDNGRYDEINLIEYASRAPDLHKRLMRRYFGSPPNKLFVSGSRSCNETVCSKPDLAEDFNLYVFHWLPGRLTWQINEKWYLADSTERFSADPFQLILNLELGESFFDEFPPLNVSTWVKPTLEIDWVRVYSNATQPAQNRGATQRQSTQHKLVVVAFLCAFLYATKS